MLSFGWVFGATLLLTLQQSSLALPYAGAHQPDQPAHLQARYRIVGQPPPPCVNKICPLIHRRSESDETDYSSGQSGKGSETQPKAPAGDQPKTPHFPGTHQTAPINCGDGTKPPCGQGKPEHETPHFPGTHQTAPINCGDGTKPPCGQSKPGNEATHFPGTHQSAPIKCGDGTKPPCGESKSGYEATHFPGTHQSAPIYCGDGSKPPCGKSKPVDTYQTAPVDCGDGKFAPCVITDPGREPPHTDLPHRPANPCPDDTAPPCKSFPNNDY